VSEDKNIERKLRSLETLALRPGNEAEGALARQRAIEIATKYSLPCVFTTPNYVPPAKQFRPIPPTPPKPTKLHPTVLSLEHKLKREGWKYSHFTDGMRVYKLGSRPAEEIHMTAHWFGDFSCQHYYKPTRRYRPAGTTPRELDHFFNSIAYRHELWPDPTQDRPRNATDFLEPPLPPIDSEFYRIFNPSDVPEPEQPVEEIHEAARMMSNRQASPEPEEEEIEELVEDYTEEPDERTDVIDDMLGGPRLKKVAYATAKMVNPLDRLW